VSEYDPKIRAYLKQKKCRQKENNEYHEGKPPSATALVGRGEHEKKCAVDRVTITTKEHRGEVAKNLGGDWLAAEDKARSREVEWRPKRGAKNHMT